MHALSGGEDERMCYRLRTHVLLGLYRRLGEGEGWPLLAESDTVFLILPVLSRSALFVDSPSVCRSWYPFIIYNRTREVYWAIASRMCTF